MAKKKPCKKPVGNGAYFEGHIDPSGEFRFKLVAPNDECIAVGSEGYDTEEGLATGIAAVKKWAKGATFRMV
jgi:uncharacterized protein YegP (UPF0339 family)